MADISVSKKEVVHSPAERYKAARVPMLPTRVTVSSGVVENKSRAVREEYAGILVNVTQRS